MSGAQLDGKEVIGLTPCLTEWKRDYIEMQLKPSYAKKTKKKNKKVPTRISIGTSGEGFSAGHAGNGHLIRRNVWSYFASAGSSLR
jgi:hypothetical protein